MFRFADDLRVLEISGESVVDRIVYNGRSYTPTSNFDAGGWYPLNRHTSNAQYTLWSQTQIASMPRMQQQQDQHQEFIRPNIAQPFMQPARPVEPQQQRQQQQQQQQQLQQQQLQQQQLQQQQLQQQQLQQQQLQQQQQQPIQLEQRQNRQKQERKQEQVSEQTEQTKQKPKTKQIIDEYVQKQNLSTSRCMSSSSWRSAGAKTNADTRHAKGGKLYSQAKAIFEGAYGLNSRPRVSHEELVARTVEMCGCSNRAVYALIYGYILFLVNRFIFFRRSHDDVLHALRRQVPGYEPQAILDQDFTKLAFANYDGNLAKKKVQL